MLRSRRASSRKALMLSRPRREQVPGPLRSKLVGGWREGAAARRHGAPPQRWEALPGQQDGGGGLARREASWGKGQTQAAPAQATLLPGREIGRRNIAQAG